MSVDTDLTTKTHLVLRTRIRASATHETYVLWTMCFVFISFRFFNTFWTVSIGHYYYHYSYADCARALLYYTGLACTVENP